MTYTKTQLKKMKAIEEAIAKYFDDLNYENYLDSVKFHHEFPEDFAEFEYPTPENTEFLAVRGNDWEVKVGEEAHKYTTGEPDVLLMYDGGYLYSVMSNEFGYTLRESFERDLLEPLSKKYKFDYEDIANWCMGFYFH